LEYIENKISKDYDNIEYAVSKCTTKLTEGLAICVIDAKSNYME